MLLVILQRWIMLFWLLSVCLPVLIFRVSIFSHFMVTHLLFLPSSKWRGAMLCGWSSGGATPCSGSAWDVWGRSRLCCKRTWEQGDSCHCTRESDKQPWQQGNELFAKHQHPRPLRNRVNSVSKFVIFYKGLNFSCPNHLIWKNERMRWFEICNSCKSMEPKCNQRLLY